MKNKLLCLLIVTALFIASCGWNSKMSDLPGVDIPLNKMNNEFILIDPGIGNSYRNGEMLFLGIQNKSTQSIVFSQDYGIKIFVRRDQIWEPVKNIMQYPDGETQLSGAKNDPLSLTTTGFVPVISDIKSAEIIRVVIMGHLENNENSMIGAYIDVKIYPE